MKSLNTLLKRLRGVQYKNISLEPNAPSYYPFYYCGARVEQSQYVFPALDSLAKVARPKRIIELGYKTGGFTLLLADHELSIDSEIHAFDFSQEDLKIEVPDKVEIHNKNFLESKTIREIGELIKQDGQTIVFCDGGNKAAEFNFYSRFLKKGDIILAHDYAPNKETFEVDYKGRLWDWHEINDGDIQKVVREEGLHSFLEERFNLAAWTCKIKL